MARVTERQVLEKMRKVCATLADCQEVTTYGHPGFKAGGRLFAVLEEYKGKLSLAVKVGLEVQGLFLKDARYYLTPYIGGQGWISLDVHAGPINWEEVRELMVGSYKLVTKERTRRAAKGRRRPVR